MTARYSSGAEDAARQTPVADRREAPRSSSAAPDPKAHQVSASVGIERRSRTAIVIVTSRRSTLRTTVVLVTAEARRSVSARASIERAREKKGPLKSGIGTEGEEPQAGDRHRPERRAREGREGAAQIVAVTQEAIGGCADSRVSASTLGQTSESPRSRRRLRREVQDGAASPQSPMDSAARTTTPSTRRPSCATRSRMSRHPRCRRSRQSQRRSTCRNRSPKCR